MSLAGEVTFDELTVLVNDFKQSIATAKPKPPRVIKAKDTH